MAKKKRRWLRRGWFRRFRSLGIKQKQPGWVDKYNTGTNWAAVRNPALEEAKDRRYAKFMLWGILSALPISLVSCAVVLVAQDRPASVVYAQAAEPDGKAIAEKAAARWVTDSGFVAAQIVWEGWRATTMPCRGGTCEIHTFLALLSNGVVAEQVRLELTLAPSDGSVSGVSLAAASDSAGETEGSSAWSDAYAVAGALPSDFGVAREEWASAWASNDQLRLRRLANMSGEHPTLGLPGWSYVSGSAVTVGKPVGGPDRFHVTSDITVAPPAGPECQRSGVGVIAPQHCDSSLTLRMNLTVVSDSGLVYIVGAAPVGDLSASDIAPPTQTDSPTTTEPEQPAEPEEPTPPTTTQPEEPTPPTTTQPEEPTPPSGRESGTEPSHTGTSVSVNDNDEQATVDDCPDDTEYDTLLEECAELGD